MKLQEITNIILISPLLLIPIVYQTINIPKTTAETNLTNTKQSTHSQVKTYILNRTISISYPSKWIFSKSSPNYIIITNKPPKYAESWPYDFIKTDITIEEVSLQDALSNYTSNTGMEKDILKVEKIRINNREGYRIWSIGEHSNVVSTLVYVSANRTASVNTFHNPKNTKILPTVYKIHNSLKVLR
jgi:hypothetical protein